MVRIDAIPSTSLDTIRVRPAELHRLVACRCTRVSSNRACRVLQSEKNEHCDVDGHKAQGLLLCVQEWLSSINVKFYESKINLNWKPILKAIIEVRSRSTLARYASLKGTLPYQSLWFSVLLLHVIKGVDGALLSLFVTGFPCVALSHIPACQKGPQQRAEASASVLQHNCATAYKLPHVLHDLESCVRTAAGISWTRRATSFRMVHLLANDMICEIQGVAWLQDPEGFVEDGGWSFLDQEGGSDAEGEEDESEGDGARMPPLAAVGFRARACKQPGDDGTRAHCCSHEQSLPPRQSSARLSVTPVLHLVHSE